MRVLVFGVNGCAGRAIAAEFACAGWHVSGTGRDPARFPISLADLGVRFVCSDRHDLEQLRAVLASGADVVVDCLCYTAEHARQLLTARTDIGSAIVLSSKAVYVDAEGRHANSEDPPRFNAPVTEQQAVMPPDFSGEYESRKGYGRNKVAAEVTLLDSGMDVSILRPSRIHGPGVAPQREWFIVKRILDGRHRIPLAHGGRAGNHPTAAANLARLALACATTPGRRILNAADPGTPTASEIVTAIGEATGAAIDTVGLPDDAPNRLGWTPWNTWPPFFLDTAAADAIGYHPAGSYAGTVAASVRELLGIAPDKAAQLNEDPYFAGRFDYALDDLALRLAS